MKKRTCALVLTVSLLLCTGCTPKEKTILLPDTRLQEGTEEESRTTGDFTVKRIFTYEYETEYAFRKSAFLRGCEEHEIRVAATEELENGSISVCRTVDYRYGFYDSTGLSESLFENTGTDREQIFWRLWNRPAPSVEEPEDTGEDLIYTLENLLLSPDGARMLVYARAESWDNRLIWLYDFETRQPWLLYEGTTAEYELPTGSFSPSGRWVTFDIKADTTRGKIAVYDCHKEIPTDSTEQEKRIDLNVLASLYPPDRVLHPADETTAEFKSSRLIEFQDQPGIITLLKDGNTSNSIKAVEYYIRGISELYEEEPFYSEDMYWYREEMYWYTENEYWLYGLSKNPMPYIQYELECTKEENRLYYLVDAQQLWNLDMTEGTTTGPIDFSDLTALFLRLDNGDMLALHTSDMEKYGWILPNNHSLSAIPSSDLYLHIDGEADGQLLYKNLRNVTSMEYDPETHRILLETVENNDWTHRKCIILEM